MQVKALTRGYYADRIVEPDQVFTLKDPSHFTPAWMESVGGAVPSAAKPTRAPKPKKVDEVAPDFS